MRHFLMTTIAAAAVALGSTAGLANPASSITVTGFSVPYGDIVLIDRDGAGPSAPENVIAGQILLQTSASGTISTWCTDAYHDLGDGTFTLVSLTNDGSSAALSSAQIQQIGYLMDKFAGGSLVGSVATMAEASAATQLAIWSIEYPAMTFTANDNKLNNTTVGNPTGGGLVASYLGAIPAGVSGYTVAEYTAPNNQNQSFLNGTGSTNSFSVPEPASMLLLASAISGLVAVRRRKVSA